MRGILALTVCLVACAQAGSGSPNGTGDDESTLDGGPTGNRDANTGSGTGSGQTCPDTDGDGVCNADDKCAGFDDNVDTDADTVADGCDQCPGRDDRVDANMNGMPDCTEAQTKTFTVKVVNGNYWRGWISLSGTSASHQPTLDNTFTGGISGTPIYNSYFVFPLTGFTASTILDVTLRLQVQGFEMGNNDTETISVWDVTTPSDQVENTAGSAAIHQDLQSGIKYGMFDAKATDIGNVLTTVLNADAAAGVKAHLGQDFTIGCHLDTFPGYLLFSSNSEVQTHELVVRYLP